MNLIAFTDNKNKTVYVNPDNVTHVKEYKDDSTIIYFNCSHELQLYVIVSKDVKQVANKIITE